MANKNDNLIPEAHKLTVEDQSNGGKRSGEVRRENATMRKQLEMLLKSTNGNGKKYSDLVSLGLIVNAIDKNKGGNPKAYELIARMLGQIEQEEQTSTPELKIEIVNNEDLEAVMYENNDKS